MTAQEFANLMMLIETAHSECPLPYDDQRMGRFVSGVMVIYGWSTIEYLAYKAAARPAIEAAVGENRVMFCEHAKQQFEAFRQDGRF